MLTSKPCNLNAFLRFRGRLCVVSHATTISENFGSKKLGLWHFVDYLSNSFHMSGIYFSVLDYNKYHPRHHASVQKCTRWGTLPSSHLGPLYFFVRAWIKSFVLCIQILTFQKKIVVNVKTKCFFRGLNPKLVICYCARKTSTGIWL